MHRAITLVAVVVVAVSLLGVPIYGSSVDEPFVFDQDDTDLLPAPSAPSCDCSSYDSGPSITDVQLPLCLWPPGDKFVCIPRFTQNENFITGRNNCSGSTAEVTPKLVQCAVGLKPKDQNESDEEAEDSEAACEVPVTPSQDDCVYLPCEDTLCMRPTHPGEVFLAIFEVSDRCGYINKVAAFLGNVPPDEQGTKKSLTPCQAGHRPASSAVCPAEETPAEKDEL
eukprot:TRINITY_DN11681_c0_g1_i1.p1 TRINITY_DN11681_c0_g1~~TRINITY_DN11681_c0_g1_i1.p1  ORF type:complete len:225 (-),score=49.09 TRINITY_DN11681_c0_g1_i1:6-680(-)